MEGGSVPPGPGSSRPLPQGAFPLEVHMKLDEVIERLSKFGFTPDYVTHAISGDNPASGYERLKMELLVRYDEMGKPEHLKEDYEALDSLKLKSVVREGDKEDKDIDRFLDWTFNSLLPDLDPNVKEFLQGAYRNDKEALKKRFKEELDKMRKVREGKGGGK